MASTTITVMTPTLSGAVVVASSTTGYQYLLLGSSQTMTVQPSTAQSALDMKSLHIRIENVNSITTVALSLAAGTRYSEIGQGAKSITVGTAAAVILGGQDFEDARFMNTAGTIIFTQTGTGPTLWEAYQAPRNAE